LIIQVYNKKSNRTSLAKFQDLLSKIKKYFMDDEQNSAPGNDEPGNEPVIIPETECRPGGLNIAARIVARAGRVAGGERHYWHTVVAAGGTVGIK
jgi:hypothetical protein